MLRPRRKIDKEHEKIKEKSGRTEKWKIHFPS